MKTYGNLNFTLADGEIGIVIHIHSFESILGAVATLHEEYYRESA